MITVLKKKIEVIIIEKVDVSEVRTDIESIKNTSTFLEVLLDSNAHFSSYKAVIWQSYRKGSIKKYYILGIL